MTGFATDLAASIRSHDNFWTDYNNVRSSGVVASLRANGACQQNEAILRRLLYSASVFSQSKFEKDIFLAQSIALSAMLVSKDGAIFETAVSVLAQVGNFPSIEYVRHNVNSADFTLAADLRVHLLRELNTIDLHSGAAALTDFQLDVWKALPEIRVGSISAPTSAGKSFVVIEYLCKRYIGAARLSGVYLAPTRALLGEVYGKLAAKLSDIPGLHISTVPAVAPAGTEKVLYVLTQERLSVLLSVSNISPNLLVIDEAQNIGDGARGMILQDCLERILDRDKNVQVVLLSPGGTGFPSALRSAGVENVSLNETKLSPVLQNRIVVQAVEGEPHALDLFLLSEGGQTHLQRVNTKLGMGAAATRLTSVALELGAEGGSLVYASGPVEADKAASRLVIGLEEQNNPHLKKLSDFIREHIHDRYGLARKVMYGVAFHYGKMPALLREAIEKCFQDGHLKFLVCTTTLFQGVNLPARNIFIDTPTRGQGTKLDPAMLWNFIGRAGRLSKDVVGNVFLIDYNAWDERPLDQPSDLKVVSALAKAVTANTSRVIDALNGAMPKEKKRGDDAASDIRAAAGYLLARAAKGTAKTALTRIDGLSGDEIGALAVAATNGVGIIKLPAVVIEENWTVDPFGMARLRDHLELLFLSGDIAEYIPCEPTAPRAFSVYSRVFNSLAREVLLQNAVKLGGFVSNYALPWMRGTKYPVILSKWIKSKQKKSRASDSVDPHIRTGFEFIEDELRFKWVQLGRAYIDVIGEVLERNDAADKKKSIFDFSLALELGVATKTARSMIELGLSRISAAAIADLANDSEMTVDDVAAFLRRFDFSAVSISSVIVDELVGLNLVGNKAKEVPDGKENSD